MRFRRALILRPDLAEAHVNLGNILQAQGKLEEAVASHERAIALKPGFAEAFFNRANALQAQGKLEEAVVSYQRALAFNDVTALVELVWGGSYTLRHDVVEALCGSNDRHRLVESPVVPGHELCTPNIVTYGRNFATVQVSLRRTDTLEPGAAGRNRQTQTWRRTVDGWRLVSATLSGDLRAAA